MGPLLNFQNMCSMLMFACMVHAVLTVQVFNVKDFGAIADGATDNTKAFLAAWNKACTSNSISTVLVPQGTFLVGPVVFEGPCKSAMTFQLKGVMRAPGLEKFQSDGWIEFRYINGLMVKGGGTFDGQGAAAWPYNKCPKEEDCKLLPTSVRFCFITNGIIRHISSVNSKLFHMNIIGSKNIKVRSVKISAPGNSPNTDGIHIGDSSRVSISDSVIGTGDDCISIGPGNSDISISNIFCGPGHGISVGSLGKYPDEKNVVGLSVTNCTLKGTTNGVRIKTWQDSSVLSASKFFFKDLVMHNVYNPIIIDQEYCPYESCSHQYPSRVQIRDISFTNIRGSSASEVAVNLLCSKGFPCQNVQLNNIDLVYKSGSGPTKSFCSYVNGTSSGQQNPPSCL